MSIRRCAGMTLIEMVMAIVIISVGLAGVLLAYTTVVKSSAEPMIRKQMLAIADEMMEEIALKPFATAANAAPPACARNTYNDIFDYNGYAATGICDIDGVPIPGLANYAVGVAVVAAPLDTISSANAAKITVSASNTTTSETIQLTGWRTWYACETACPP